MTTEFYAELKDLEREALPEGLLLTANDGRLEIGACRGNSDRRKSLALLIQERDGEWPAGTFSGRSCVTISELVSSRKHYYSKWNYDSPIEFFDTDLRFCWQIPILLQSGEESESNEIQEPEDFQKAMLDFWNSILKEGTPVYHSSLYPINNWEDLREAIFGNRRYIEPSRFVQGTCPKYAIHIN